VSDAVVLPVAAGATEDWTDTEYAKWDYGYGAESDAAAAHEAARWDYGDDETDAAAAHEAALAKEKALAAEANEAAMHWKMEYNLKVRENEMLQLMVDKFTALLTTSISTPVGRRTPAAG
jgi:transcriptional antiterminator Rof (Rho-off)